jgi:isopentenyl-diphosphate Delta-isomerase
VAYSEKYIDAALRRVKEELGLILEEHDASSSSRLTQVCKMYIDAKDEDYNYGFPGSIISNPGGKVHLLQYMNA